jgi:hypothetical protein
MPARRVPAPGGGGAEATTTTSPASGKAPALGERELVKQAWIAAVDAFYLASSKDDARSPGLVATLAPAGPDYTQETTYIAAQSVSGVAGPSTWQVGGVVVESLTASRAMVSGCSFDRGSHYRSSGLPAPPSLGGSPGLTGYLATMEQVNGRWLLFATQVSAPANTQEAGPCHDFAEPS